MANLGTYNANDHDPLNSPLPADEYLAAICDSEEKTSPTTGAVYIKFTFEVLEGKYKGRRVSTNVHRRNENPVAVQMGNQALSSICRALAHGRPAEEAAKLMQPTDTLVLHRIPLCVKVTCKKRVQDGVETGDIDNDIRGYFPASRMQERKAAPAGAADESCPWGG